MKYIMFYESFPFNQSFRICDYVELIDDDEGRLKGYWQIEDIELDTFKKTKTGCIYELVRGEDILSEDAETFKNIKKLNL